jgi:hypothetical protein
VFKNNKISDVGLKGIAENFPDKMTELDVSENFITSFGC